MTSGGMRRPVEPSYPWMSLPQMPHAFTRTSTRLRRSADRHVDNGQLLVLGQEQRSHQRSAKQGLDLRIDGEDASDPNISVDQTTRRS